MFDVKIIKPIIVVLSETENIIIETGDVWTIFGMNNNKFLCFDEGKKKWFKIPMEYCIPYKEEWC